MATDEFAIRLKEARLMMGFSMDKLVERTGGVITKQSISRYERGVMRPKRDAEAALAKALNISEDYFHGTNLQIDLPMLRSTSDDKLTTGELAALEAKLSFWAEQYLDKEKKAGIHTCFKNPVPKTPVAELDDTIHAANLLRKRWNCGDGPLPGLLRLLERKGIKIMAMELPHDVWGMSTWADKKHPLIVIDLRPEKTTVDRLRFTAAHELAHLLLTFPKSLEHKQIEKLCSKFAGFFLFPKDTFIDEMGSAKRTQLTLEELIDLKEVYGVSVAAQVHEAWDLQMIPREHYDRWYDERIKKNRKETGWGDYKFPETIGRERRIESRIENEGERK